MAAYFLQRGIYDKPVRRYAFESKKGGIHKAGNELTLGKHRLLTKQYQYLLGKARKQHLTPLGHRLQLKLCILLI